MICQAEIMDLCEVLSPFTVAQKLCHSLSTWVIPMASKLTFKNGYNGHFMTRSMR